VAAPLHDRVHLRPNFLAPADVLRVISALDRLSASWIDSGALALLGRGGTSQVRATDLMAQAPLDELRSLLAPAVLRWVQSRGFGFATPPTLQLFPVRMIGSEETPAYQEPHVDSYGADAGPPVCTNVYYARATAASGGELVVAKGAGADLDDPIVVTPQANTLATFPGARVHAVRPLRGGERLSVVINFY
jgi:hypothetical protein